MRCAAAAPLSEPAKAEIDGTQIRFKWPFDKAALVVTVQILSPTELDGQVSVERGSAASPLLGPAHLTKLDPAPPGDGRIEAMIRGVVADLRRGRLDGDAYVADRVDALSAKPALHGDELVQLGDLEIVTDLGEMQVLNRDLDTGRKLAGFTSDILALARLRPAFRRGFPPLLAASDRCGPGLFVQLLLTRARPALSLWVAAAITCYGWSTSRCCCRSPYSSC
ncbi:MAG: hypothetical protein WDN69_31940, partial [Aliidongia sp.]